MTESTAGPAVSTSKDPRHRLGAVGEQIAEHFLTRAGMVVVDRNWRCRAGEIDLVVRDGDDLVVCEVKTRGGTAFGTPVEAITRAKLGRLRRLAGMWLAAHPQHRSRGVRLDVVGVLRHPDGTFAVTHLKGVGA